MIIILFNTQIPTKSLYEPVNYNSKNPLSADYAEINMKY